MYFVQNCAGKSKFSRCRKIGNLKIGRPRTDRDIEIKSFWSFTRVIGNAKTKQ